MSPIIGSAVPTAEQDRVQQLQMGVAGLIVKSRDQYGAMHESTISPGGVTSNPPSGKYKVTNIYVDPVTGKLTVQYDDTPT